MRDPKKSPYRGQIAIILALIAPSVSFTLIFYGVISMWQGRFGVPLNFASAKALGCGLGCIFHLTCFINGSFAEPYGIVRDRMKEFFSDLKVSGKLALKWYFDDIKTNGISLWIDMGIILINFWVCADAANDFLILRGIKL